jgi:hypothetical protein
MSDPSTEESFATCPLCGSPAEFGCVYGADKWPLQWYPGEPGVLGNIMTGLGTGQRVGGWGLGAGPYAAGIRCDKCRRIILSY